MEAEQLSELIAIEQDKKQKLHGTIGHLIQLFTKKDSLLEGYQKCYIPFQPESFPKNSTLEVIESKQLAYTLREILLEANAVLTQGIDLVVSKEETYASAAARTELFVNNIYFGNFSLLALEALETILHRLKEVYTVLPTLDATQSWEKIEDAHQWHCVAEKKFRTQKVPKVVVKYEATPEHPAQTEIIYIEEIVGEYITHVYSGKIKQSQKNQILERLSLVLEAVKKAKAKIGAIAAQKKEIGQQLFDFLYQDIFD
ncbi:MAG: hypothetical protein RML72_07495 [Bacteroidia bacterium]|nr:hypothetical protein [Bacteroidia bacterium]MDW8158705.1 hypothetical protein [Bacteroidia bacterium]